MFRLLCIFLTLVDSGSNGVVFTNKGAAGASPFCREKLSKNDSPSVELGSEEPGASKHYGMGILVHTCNYANVCMWMQLHINFFNFN